MSDHIAQQEVKQITLEATVIRKDGSVEHLGKIAEYHRNPLKRAWTRLRGFGKITI